MHSKVILEWTFTPPDFFEEEVTIERPNYTVTIDNGKVKATFDAELYDANPKVRDTLSEELHARFLGANLVSRRPFTLSGANLMRIHPNGRRDVEVVLEVGSASIAGGSLDTVVTDRDGNIISDSKRERIEKRKLLASRVGSLTSDPTVGALLKSNDAAVKEPAIELVRLYEIGDSLRAKFGNEKKACDALGLDPDKWARFERLCNDKEIRQARHRGQSIGQYRDATASELVEARTIAAEMIERYVDYREAASAVAVVKGPIQHP